MQEQNKHKEIKIYWDKFLNDEDEYDAFSLIYKLHVNNLLSYGTSLGFDEDICRDVVHDIFYKLFINKKNLYNVKNITAYLFRACRNHLLNIQKKSDKILDFAFENSTVETLTFKTEITVLDALISEEEAAKLKKTVEELINSLTPRQREAIYLRYMQEMDYEEIASLLNMSPNSARRLVFRGMESLREKASNTDTPLSVFFIILICFFRPS